MIRILNYLFFFGTLARYLAKFLAPVLPSFSDLKEANRRDKFIKALEDDINNDKLKPTQNENVFSNTP